MINRGMMSSNTDLWGTPIDFFKKIDEEFHFNLDPCCTKENHKCETFFTKEQDGLKQSWKGYRVFCNPPYGREISKWVEKAYNENKEGTLVVLLLPARTDTRWFHNWVYKHHEIRFLKGRLKFNDCGTPAPFPSMLVIMKGESNE